MEIRLVEMLETTSGVNILICRSYGQDTVTWWRGTEKRSIQIGKGVTREAVISAFREVSADNLWSAPHFNSVLGGE